MLFVFCQTVSILSGPSPVVLREPPEKGKEFFLLPEEPSVLLTKLCNDGVLFFENVHLDSFCSGFRITVQIRIQAAFPAPASCGDDLSCNVINSTYQSSLGFGLVGLRVSVAVRLVCICYTRTFVRLLYNSQVTPLLNIL